MPSSAGSNTVNDSIVFNYDIEDVCNSYKGEPTTNILYAGDPQLNDMITWTNSGTWTANDNDTSVPKPYIPGVDTSNLLIMSGVTITVGSQHVGCAYYTSLTPSTTYTISVWFMQNRAGSNQPYLRTNINNNSLGNFNYNGDTNAANWPINQWIRILCTGTIQSNENGLYLSNYIGGAVGDKVWYFAPQLEQNSHATSLSLGTRSSTQGLLDISPSNNTITLACSYNAGAKPYFDGTDDYMNANIALNTDCTMELIIQSSDYSGNKIPFSIDGDNYGSGPNLYFTGGIIAWNTGDGGNNAFSNSSYPNSNYHHIVVSNTWGSSATLYIDGTQIGTASSLNAYTTGANKLWIGRFHGGGYVIGANIPIVKVYNRGLTSTEVKQNYNAYKTRFNLS